MIDRFKLFILHKLAIFAKKRNLDLKTFQNETYIQDLLTADTDLDKLTVYAKYFQFEKYNQLFAEMKEKHEAEVRQYAAKAASLTAHQIVNGTISAKMIMVGTISATELISGRKQK